MTIPPRLNDALKRLTSALDQLDAAQSRRAQADENRGNLDEELAVMQDDRSRLAVELDAALTRARSLSLANEEAHEKLSKIAGSLRHLLPEPPAGAGGGETS